MIPEVASFKEEGLVTPEDEKEKKKIGKFVGSCRKLNPDHLSANQTFVLEEGNFNTLPYIIKAPVSPILHYLRLR